MAYKPLVTACWRDSEPMGTCFHERLLKRPKGEDSLLSARRHAQGPGGAHLPREPLFGQTLPRQSQQRKISCPQEEAGGRPEARREGHEAARRRSRRTPLHLTLQERCDYVQAMTGLSV